MQYKIITSLLLILPFAFFAQRDLAKEEAKYYKIVDVPIPENVVLEVGGLALTENDQLAACKPLANKENFGC